MTTKGNTYFRYAFSAAFALGATAALFSLLHVLINTHILKPTSLAATSPITIRTITISSNSSRKEKIKAIASNTPPTNIKTQQQIAPQPIIKDSPVKKHRSIATRNQAIQNKPAETKLSQTQIESKPQPITPVTTQPVMQNVTTAPTKQKVIKETIQLAEIGNPKQYAEFVVDAKELKKVYSPSPSYPRKAQRRNIQGWVITEFNIRTDGSIAQIEIVDGKNTTFFKNEVLKTLASWRFAQFHSQEIRASMRFVFNLNS